MTPTRYCQYLIQLVIALLIVAPAGAQCPASASFVIKESRCKENGAITINVTPSGTYTYEIISGPELAALSSSNVFTGLGAGNYVISVYGAGCSANYAVTVPGNYQDPGLLTASTTLITCPTGTGCINADQPTNGRPPYQYSIVSGPVTRPLQSGRSFCGLPGGSYTVNALDSCGVIRTSQFNLGYDTGYFYGYVFTWDIRFANCTDLILRSQGDYYDAAVPKRLRVWYVTPSGDTLKVNDFVAPGTTNIDTLAGMARNYGIWKIITHDECGRTREGEFHFLKPTVNETTLYDAKCSGIGIMLRNYWYESLATGAIIRRCSDNSIVYTVNNPPNSGLWNIGATNLDYNECYIIETFSECGDTIRNTITTPGRALSVDACASASCTYQGKTRISFYLNNASRTVMPVTYTIIAGPGDIGRSLINTDQWQRSSMMENLTPGIYTIVAQNGCGDKDTLLIDASRGLSRTMTITQTPHCSGGSNLHVKIVSNRLDCGWLQNGYGPHWLVNGVQSTSPSYPKANVTQSIISLVDNTGIWEADFYDVRTTALTLTVGSESMDGYGCSFDTTISIVQYSAPTLQDITGYVCSGNSLGTINYRVNGGVPPYRFRIKPDASSTWGPWQDSSLFTGIAVGTYDINVEDACPNGSIRSVSFLPWQRSGVTISNPCATIGSPVTLSADPAVSFVGYQWLFNNVVVGTGPSYTINAYNVTHQGTYKLRQVFRGGVCVDSATTMLLTCSVLPLTLASFTGELMADVATLRWNTLTDIHQLQFVVEKSGDGAVFNKIAAIHNSANTDGSQYFHVDNEPADVNFYRLAYFTPGGTTYYSQVIKLSKSRSAINNNVVTITPVPFKNRLQVQVQSRQSEQLVIRLYDVLGKKLLDKKVRLTKGPNNILLEEELAALNRGYYFVELANDTIMERRKILKE